MCVGQPPLFVCSMHFLLNIVDLSLRGTPCLVLSSALNLPDATQLRRDNLFYPMPAPKDERRSRNRISASLPVTIKPSAATSASGVTRDLSLSGVFFYTDVQIREGSEVEIVVMLPAEVSQGERQWVCCQASVVRIEASGDNGRMGVAARINSLASLPEIPR